MGHIAIRSLLILILIAGAPAYGAQEKVIAVPRASSPITIDGRLGEPAWAAAGRIPSFEHYRLQMRLKNRTEVRLLYDEEALYVAFACGEANMGAVKASVADHDGGVWDDDCVEVFLDTQGDQASFVHFILNTLNTQYDALGSDPHGWNPKWEGKVSRWANVWKAEIRIPFRELGLEGPPAPGHSWLGNFCREEQPAQELSCWSATMGNFDSPGRFGRIIFGSLVDGAQADLQRIRKELDSLRRSSAESGRGSDMLVKAHSAAAAAHALLSEPGKLAEPRYRDVQALLATARESASSLREMVRRAAMGNPEYLVWETIPWRHFSAKEDSSHVGRDTQAIGVLSLAGQTESKALMVSNLTDETLSARVLVEGFEGVETEILLPTFVRTADGRPFPDALVPLDPIGGITVPPGETRQVWINFEGAKGGRFSGKLTISPLTASKTDKQVRFDLEIVEPTMEVPRPLAFTWDFLGDAVRLDLEKEYVRSMVDHGIRVFMISGLHHMPRPKADDSGEFLEPVDWSKFRRQVELVWRPGRKLYITMDVWEKSAERPIYNGKFASPGWCAAFKKIIGEMVVELARLGLSGEDYVVNPLDESIDERYVTIARLIKEVHPGIRVVEDTIGSSLDEVKAADPYTDWWIPHFKSVRAASAKEQVDYMKATGEPVGFYFYSEGANEKAQDSYGHYLWKFWWAYSQGLNGMFGYWTATQHYGDPWNRHQTEAAYDPSLFYYGNGCVITGRRWEAWRRGIEDFALLHLCEKSGLDKAVISEAVKSVLDAPTDPAAGARAREKLIRSLSR